MTFQEILEGITRHRAARLDSGNKEEIDRKLDEIEWALQALAELLRDREQELSAVAPRERGRYESAALNEVDDAFEEYARGTS